MGKYMVGLQLLIIGMGTVLLSLFLLSLFLRFSGRVLGPDSEKKKENLQKTKSGKKINISDNKKENNESTKNDNKISNKKRAAITAALYNYFDDDKKYKIISIRKQNSKWKS